METEFGKKIHEKAVRFRGKEGKHSLNINNTPEMCGELKEETNGLPNDFYTDMVNTVNEKEPVKKTGRTER